MGALCPLCSPKQQVFLGSVRKSKQGGCQAPCLWGRKGLGNAPVQPGANFAKEELIVHVLCLQGHVEDLGALLEVEAVQWYQLHLSVMPAFTSGKDCHLHVVTGLMLPFLC